MSKNVDVTTLSQEQLVARFLVIALEQDQALLFDEYGRYNRLYDKMEAVEAELRNRDGDQRTLLLSLYEHDNAQVRLKAALATLALAPDASRAVLQEISDSNRYPEAASAREMMGALDDGSYVPS